MTCVKSNCDVLSKIDPNTVLEALLVSEMYINRTIDRVSQKSFVDDAIHVLKENEIRPIKILKSGTPEGAMSLTV